MRTIHIITRNIYAEPSKADDVQFTLALIEKIADQIPAADMDNVNIAGNFVVGKYNISDHRPITL